MSHFAVMVVTKERPTEEVLEKALAGFHEFECTGWDNEFVQDIDQTDEVRAEYEETATTRYRAPDGTLHKPYDDQFYRDPTEEEQAVIGRGGSGFSNSISYSSRDWNDGLGCRSKVHFLPEGWEEVEIPTPQLLSFTEWYKSYHDGGVLNPGEDPDLAGKHKYGYARVDENGQLVRAIRRTNENAKWDWWVLGGRWSGMFKMKAEALAREPGDLLRPLCGERSEFGGRYDGARKCDIDFLSMQNETGNKAGNRWDMIRAIVGDAINEFEPWESVREVRFAGDIEAARTYYHNQPAKKALHDAAQADPANRDLIFENLEDFICSRHEYVAKARKSAVITFAFLRDGHWAERGEMGWWACVSNEKADWEDQFEALLAAVPDDHWLSIVDCHI